MDQAKQANAPRRSRFLMSSDGMTYLRWQNPFMVAWWSAAFPGFGHFLLHHYIRGFLLCFWEVVINTMAHINEAMVYSFCGQFELAKQVLDPRWLFGYVIIYLFAICDSYRYAVESNQQYHLAEMEAARMVPFVIRPFNIVYLSKKRPWIGSFCSLMFPGVGQLYLNRLSLGFYGLFWWLVYMSLSRSHESFLLLIQGRLGESAAVLNPHWLLFMPSVIGGSVCDAYTASRDYNRMFREEQTQYFQERYPAFPLHFPKEDEGRW
ncbi:hypothetical protein [Paenibacillus sp. y28]|uniref:hypothetical protein n=1 Tax=Paenibacillus sp. y28 TaxID=3129110 RepID=UPI00301A534F